LVYATAGDVGNLVGILGAKTGKDGIGGAVFASRDIDKEQRDEDRGAIQVGDPFTEKLLLEAVLEIAEKKLVDGMQDMGAVGLSCATSEMSEKANCGMEIVLDNVNLREKNIYGYEIMLSESQERMLLSFPEKNFDEINEIAKKYELDFVIIGKVIKDKKLKVWYHNNLIANIPIPSLVAGNKAPIYIRKYKKPDIIHIAKNKEVFIEEPVDYNEDLLVLLRNPNISSKQYVYTQYDYQVGTNTVVGPGDNSAIMRVRGTKKGIAISTTHPLLFIFTADFQTAFQELS
jgi:phosphoribosylformylglycinamidine synthase